MPCCPITLARGRGKTLAASSTCAPKRMTVFQPGSEKRPGTSRPFPLSDADNLRARFGRAFDDALEAWSWPWAHPPSGTTTRLPEGKLTPCSSAGVNNFGVMEVLDAVVDMAPRPARAWPTPGQPQPRRKRPSSLKTKASRAWCSGAGQHGRQPPRPHRLCARGFRQIHPGMRMKVQRTAKELRPPAW